MHRRKFLVGVGTGVGAALGGSSMSLAAGEVAHKPYTRLAYDKRLSSGEPFLLDFFASW